MRNQLARSLRAAVSLALAFAFATHLVAPRTAHAQRSAIDTYAITNARIVTVSGAEIARGTVVIRNGLINAVGANVSAPTDARVIDGTGLTVYPGFIDANTNLGMPAAQQRPAGGAAAFLAAQQPQQPPAVSSPNSSQPVGLQPEILAADIVRAGADQFDAARNAGLTAALTAPRDGIYMGQSAFINLAGDTPQALIVRSPVALHVGFTPLRGGTYPGSLLGVFAAIRQMLLDAGRYREANAIYEKSPRGVRRPDQDKSLNALLPVLARRMPVVMYADRQREIERALDLAAEFNLRLIIAGGAESWKVADRLAAAKVPVLLSLNFPRRTTAETPEAEPDPLRLLRERVDAPKSAGRLAAAGVRFAFESGGLTNMSDYLANVAKSVDNGLARDEALRAMTIRPAEILGVADQLGTVEVGKIANLTIVRGDLFDKSRTIAHVFIDGRPVDLKPAPATTAGGGRGVGSGSGATGATGAATTGAAGVASGTWTLRVQMEGQPERAVTLALQQQAERLSGSMQGDFGSGEIANASIGANGEIKFTVAVTTGTQTTEATFTGTVSGNEMRGTVTTVGSGAGTFSGTRGATP